MKRPLALGIAAAVAISLQGAAGRAVAAPAYDREWAVIPSTLVDEVALDLRKGTGRRRAWRQVRDRVLAAYAPTGLDVTVVEQYPETRPSQVTFHDGLMMVSQLPSAVPSTQIVAHLAIGSLAYADVNDVSAPTAGILGLIIPHKPVRGSHEFAHELGHVLGLDHSLDPTSVMNHYGGPLPSEGDLRALAGPGVGLPG